MMNSNITVVIDATLCNSINYHVLNIYMTGYNLKVDVMACEVHYEAKNKHIHADAIKGFICNPRLQLECIQIESDNENIDMLDFLFNHGKFTPSLKRIDVKSVGYQNEAAILSINKFLSSISNVIKNDNYL